MQILKLGGSVLTNKRGYMAADKWNIEKLARTIAGVYSRRVRDLVVVHGAGSFGHAPVLRFGIANGVRSPQQRVGYAITHAACSRLSSMLVDALVGLGVPAVSISPAAIVCQSKKRIVKFDTKIIEDYLKAGFVPILHGDMVLDSKMGGSVLSGDRIIAYLGKKARRIVLATDVDGVLAGGRLVPKITRENFAAIKKHLTGAKTPDVTGGMAGKIAELLSVKTPIYVVNARHPERLAALLLGKKTKCTEIKF